MRVNWAWIGVGVIAGYFVLPKIIPAIKSKTS